MTKPEEDGLEGEGRVFVAAGAVIADSTKGEVPQR